MPIIFAASSRDMNLRAIDTLSVSDSLVTSPGAARAADDNAIYFLSSNANLSRQRAFAVVSDHLQVPVDIPHAS